MSPYMNSLAILFLKQDGLKSSCFYRDGSTVKELQKEKHSQGTTEETVKEPQFKEDIAIKEDTDKEPQLLNHRVTEKVQ